MGAVTTLGLKVTRSFAAFLVMNAQSLIVMLRTDSCNMRAHNTDKFLCNGMKVALVLMLFGAANVLNIVHGFL